VECIELKKYGFDDELEQEASCYEGMFPARVTEQHHYLYKVISAYGEIRAGISGKLNYRAGGTNDFPAVGDWVMIDRTDGRAGNAVISNILRRKSVFARKAAGTSNSIQIVAANIDMVFICMSLNADFNLRRLERYLSVAFESGAVPVVVLTKADLSDDLPLKLAEIKTVNADADVIVSSCTDENGLDNVRAYIADGRTIAFIGSSGVGKSTIINSLAGKEVLLTGTIRQGDDSGRHTTTHRQLILLPGGGVVIDTPGMRELQLFEGDLKSAFYDIEKLSVKCRYSDCTHTAEPGCAVKMAVEKGELSAGRLENYMKLQRETSYAGLNSRQLENEKLSRMFGGKGEMKQFKKFIKDKKYR